MGHVRMLRIDGGIAVFGGNNGAGEREIVKLSRKGFVVRRGA